MAQRRLHALSAGAVAKAREPGYYADGGGLYLQVAPGGAKTWIFRYSRRTGAGKATRPEMGLGGLHSLTLAEARDKAAICRGQLANGIDPLAAREAGEPAPRVEPGRTAVLSRTGRHSTLPQPAAAKPVRAVLRAIDVLQCLNRQPISTLDLLHRQSGLPKPTLVRLLQTLVAKGLVNHAPQSGAYYLTSVVHSLSSGYHSEPRVIEAAAPVADAITAQLKWPVAVAVFDTDAVVVRYSTIAQSPLSLLHSSLNMRLSPVSRALGRAYLAFCPEDEQDIILDLLERSANPEDQAAGPREAVKAMLRDTYKQGYAIRNPAVRPVSNTLAVPIFENGHVAASLGLTWFSSAISLKDAQKTFHPLLRNASEKIGLRLAALARAGDKPPMVAAPPRKGAARGKAR